MIPSHWWFNWIGKAVPAERLFRHTWVRGGHASTFRRVLRIGPWGLYVIRYRPGDGPATTEQYEAVPFPEPLETMPPAPTGAGLCARCGHWDAKPNKHLRCPSCGRPWDTVVGEEGVQREVRAARQRANGALVWESAGTDDPGDQVADSWNVPPGATSAYYQIGPEGDSRWSLTFIANGPDGDEGVITIGADYASEQAAKDAAEQYEAVPFN